MKLNQSAPKCGRQEELLDYLYDELPFARRAAFAGHLQECGGCREELRGLERLRGELRAWDLGLVPRVEVVIARPKLAVLRELLALFPVWARAAMATASAAALLLTALGLLSLFRQTPPPQTMVAQTNPAPEQATLTPAVKELINAEVMKAVEQERQSLRAQLAALETRGDEQRAQVQTVARQLRELRARHNELVLAQQPSIRSLFADSGEPVSER
jgi:hypothetical protein